MPASAQPPPPPSGSDPSPDDRPPLPPLSFKAKLVLWIGGGILFLVGVAGLALPGIQGILTILLAIAILSLASETAYRLLRWSLQRWPGLMRRIDRMRHRVHEWLHRKR